MCFLLLDGCPDRNENENCMRGLSVDSRLQHAAHQNLCTPFPHFRSQSFRKLTKPNEPNLVRVAVPLQDTDIKTLRFFMTQTEGDVVLGLLTNALFSQVRLSQAEKSLTWTRTVILPVSLPGALSSGHLTSLPQSRNTSDKDLLGGSSRKKPVTYLVS